MFTSSWSTLSPHRGQQQGLIIVHQSWGQLAARPGTIRLRSGNVCSLFPPPPSERIASCKRPARAPPQPISLNPLRWEQQCLCSPNPRISPCEAAHVPQRGQYDPGWGACATAKRQRRMGNPPFLLGLRFVEEYNYPDRL
jgi:hypothetical protein